mgnify:CR=1 FL=1
MQERLVDKYGSRWSRDETVLALLLYCQIPFSHASKSNGHVIQLADRIGRTPSSVARKLGNLGSFDPTLAARGVTGLVNTSRLDREIWDEFSDDWEALLDEGERIAQSGEYPGSRSAPGLLDERLPEGPTEVMRTAKVRRGQQFFRSAVVSSYRERCCFCGLDLPDLLVAGHIVPWSERQGIRPDPRNGLSLCAIHDRAYDVGHATVGTDLRIRLSSVVSASTSDAVRRMLGSLSGQRIEAPSRFGPRPEYLEWHVAHRFLG